MFPMEKPLLGESIGMCFFGGGMVFKQMKESQVTMLVLGHVEDVAEKIGQRWHKAG